MSGLKNAQQQASPYRPYTNPLTEPQKQDGKTMKIDMRWILLLAYLVGAFGTFGYVQNHAKGHDMCYTDAKGVQYGCFTDYGNRDAISIIGGLAWPAYWGGIIALNTTK